MRKTCIALCLFLCSASMLMAQDFVVKGKVVDQDTQEPLEATTIHAETLKDSTLITYTISDQNGNFVLEGKTARKAVRMVFSYNGYKQFSKMVRLGPEVDLGNIALEEQAEELQGVDVVAERVPITIKKDTLEFNADSFKVRPDATVEDMLKKLPGVEVDSDGKITVNGKEVNKVLVNGQVFFSNDPTVATKSLPKEIISKIQITDSKTKQQEFTGEDGDGENKTINLTIKKDMNKGVMGRLSAGYGTDDRYQANGLLNYFNDSERVSFLGTSNNINNSGFSFDEIYEMVGNTNGGGIRIGNNGSFGIGNLNFGFGQGITTSSTLGASYANQQKDQYKIDGNYFYSFSDSYNDQASSRENILPDRRFFTDTESHFNGSTISNQGASNLEFDIDKTLRITLQPSLSVNKTDSYNDQSVENSDADGTLTNSNNTLTRSSGSQRNFSNELEIMKKLDSLGRFVRISFNNNNRENDSESNLNSIREVFGDNASQETLDQLTTVDNSNNGYSLDFTYREHLGSSVLLDVGYTFNSSKEKNIRSVYDLDEGDDTYSLFNQALSSDFNFENRQHTPSIGIRSQNGKKLRFDLTMSYADTHLYNEDHLQQTSFSKDYGNLLFRSRVGYNFGQNKRINLNYRSSLNMPSVNQLQPIPDVSNPLNVRVGNPNLSPTTQHRINFSFNNYNWRERTGFFSYVGMNIQQNDIVSVTTTDENLLRTTTYTNVNGNYSIWSGINYSKSIKVDSTLTFKYSFSPNINYDKEIGFTNGNRLEAEDFSVSPRVSFNFNYKELLELEPEYRIGINHTQYNLESMDNVDFITHNVSFKATTYWPQNVIWGNDVVYTYNGNVGEGYDKDAVFWNMSLGLQMLKKRATVKVLAYDLLNQNINTRRSTGQDYIEDSQGTVLKRYFMGSITFKFDSFGGKGPAQRGGRGRFVGIGG